MSESGELSEPSSESPTADDDAGMLSGLLELERRGTIALVRDVLRIESGEIAGDWAVSDGRLWVLVEVG